MNTPTYTKNISVPLHISIFFASLLGLIFLWYAIFIAQYSFILSLDTAINNGISTLHSSHILNTIFIGITHSFDPKIFLSWFFLLFFILLWNKKKYEAFFLFFGVGGSQTVKIIIKWITDRERPENPFALYAHESSFPSGHAMTAIFLALSIHFLLISSLSAWKKYIITFFLFLVAGLVAFSRIFVQVHYFSDILAGTFLAIGSFSFTILFFLCIKRYYSHTNWYKKIFL